MSCHVSIVLYKKQLSVLMTIVLENLTFVAWSWCAKLCDAENAPNLNNQRRRQLFSSQSCLDVYSSTIPASKNHVIVVKVVVSICYHVTSRQNHPRILYNTSSARCTSQNGQIHSCKHFRKAVRLNYQEANRCSRSFGSWSVSLQ